VAKKISCKQSLQGKRAKLRGPAQAQELKNHHSVTKKAAQGCCAALNSEFNLA
jgi:hypothetical protein